MITIKPNLEEEKSEDEVEEVKYDASGYVVTKAYNKLW